MQAHCRFVAAFVIGLTIAHSSASVVCSEDSPELTLQTRTRVETSSGSGRFHTVTRPESWDPTKTAIVICDMWDKHWCDGATHRVAEMAPRMNEVLHAARDKGIFIIHCPSETMDFYEGTPARKLAQAAPPAEARPPVEGRCPLDFRKEAGLPINDADGGCETDCKQGSPWRRQIATLDIEAGDAVTDSSQAYDLMRERDIDNVIIMGVHTNMCVLGRPFAIREMVKRGQRVVLMRDMTDTMYNSGSAPYVSHFTGTDLVIEHIEKYWCPTITSTDFLGSAPFRFKNDKRPHLVVIMAEDEYQTESTLPSFALSYLGRDFKISHVFGDAKERHSIPGMEILKEADIALISVRRRFPKKDQLEHLRDFAAAGKPIVGVRTASHAFATRGNHKPPAGHDTWNSFDAEIFGGNYHAHHGNKGANKTLIWRVPEASSHPVLTGVADGKIPVRSWLYKVKPLKEGTTLLMMGQVPGEPPDQPIAWTFERANGGRSFYTSLGHVEDFSDPSVRRLIVNGIYWALDREIPSKLPSSAPTDFTEVAPPVSSSLLDRLRGQLEQRRAQSAGK